jgi:hypothetical protein
MMMVSLSGKQTMKDWDIYGHTGVHRIEKLVLTANYLRSAA